MKEKNPFGGATGAVCGYGVTRSSNQRSTDGIQGVLLGTQSYARRAFLRRGLLLDLARAFGAVFCLKRCA
jgi:hypothetical protein